ncbi:hypothetical protein TEA_018177 [Camellia sinensis var. sinensis]|uniref:Amine oxidase domain-containing protein n=1 Tax=Camellia sinensis var. sinensis TaxID=542762 RepID=A0A4S4D207_CAMSN|nr:hypothetical protein TEA_018177 [Camellia sinensis var. sinensis]
MYLFEFWAIVDPVPSIDVLIHKSVWFVETRKSLIAEMFEKEEVTVNICKPEADVVVIGSGIAGLSCAGLLSRYQQDVLVLESHSLPGGAAHSFEKKGYKFDSGPSLFSGFQSRGPQANPLAQVLDALGESIPCANYDSWMIYLPEGDFLSRIGPTEFFKVDTQYPLLGNPIFLVQTKPIPTQASKAPVYQTEASFEFEDDPVCTAIFCSTDRIGKFNGAKPEVLDALGESIPCANYDSWMIYLPEGDFLSRIGPTEFFKVDTQYPLLDLEKYASLDAAREWRKLLDAILPMSAAAMALPPLSIRGDWGVLSTAATRYAPSLLKSFAQMGPQGALGAMKLLRPFSEIVDSLELKEPFIRNWIDLLAFLLAGVKSNGILSAEMVYMFAEWYKPGCSLEYPIHGTGAVDALVRGLQKFGGRRISFKSHVENIVVENGQAVGVKLRSGQFVRAKKAVVSNASMWDTLDLLPKEVIPKSYQDRIKTTPQCESFMHLHLGFDAEVSDCNNQPCL